ncbi:MAG: endospore germination permease [Firmicutes bacterium]|nr:endospore germination permease [Bacillota bacterium]
MNIEDEKISGRQLTFLLFTVLIASSILILPTMIFEEAKQDAWLSIFIVAAAAVVVGLINVKLGLRFPGQTIIEYSKEIAGGPLGTLFGLAYLLLLFYVNILVIREFAELLKIQFFPETPVELFPSLMVLAAAYAVRRGLEVLCRINEILLPLVMLFALGGLFLIFKELDFAQILPALSNGFMPVLKGAYPAIFFFTETNLIALILPALNNQRRALKSTLTAVLSASFLFAVLSIAALALLGLRAADYLAPVPFLFRYISAGSIIERQETLIMSLWMAIALVKMGIFYFCLCQGAARWAGLRDYGPLVLPIGVLLVLISIIHIPDINALREMIIRGIPAMLSVQVGLPLLLLITAAWRGKGGTADEKTH